MLSPACYPGVLLSSTSVDLKEYRLAARDAIAGMEYFPIMMEYFPAMPADAVHGCLTKVDDAALYVGILAHRYGFCPENSDISITEMEFDRAGQRGMSRLVFLV